MGNRRLTWCCPWSLLCSHGPRIRKCPQPSHRPVSRGGKEHTSARPRAATPGQPCPGVALPRPPPGIPRTPSPFHLPAVKWMMRIQAAMRSHKTRAAPGTGHTALIGPAGKPAAGGQRALVPEERIGGRTGRATAVETRRAKGLGRLGRGAKPRQYRPPSRWKKRTHKEGWVPGGAPRAGCGGSYTPRESGAGMGVGEGGETRVPGEKTGQESRGGAGSKGTGVTRAVQVGERKPGATGANPGDTCGAHVGGDVETPGPTRPLPPGGSTLASPSPPPPRSLHAILPSGKDHGGPFTRAVVQPPTPPLPPLPPAETTHATPLLRPGPPESPSAGAVPRDNEPLSRDSGRRWVAVARSRGGVEDVRSMRVAFGGGAEPPRVR